MRILTCIQDSHGGNTLRTKRQKPTPALLESLGKDLLRKLANGVIPEVRVARNHRGQITRIYYGSWDKCPYIPLGVSTVLQDLERDGHLQSHRRSGKGGSVTTIFRYKEKKKEWQQEPITKEEATPTPAFLLPEENEEDTNETKNRKFFERFVHLPFSEVQEMMLNVVVEMTSEIDKEINQLRMRKQSLDDLLI